MNSKNGLNKLRSIVLLFIVCAMIVVGQPMRALGAEMHPDSTIDRADIISIDNMKMFGRLDRSIVQFPHDLHTAALTKQGKDCSACHQRQEDSLRSPLFMRLSDVDYKTDMDIYHDGCIACHKDNPPDSTGPTACGDCHLREMKYVSTWQPIGFDKSLHHRHAEANRQQCELCHHVYDSTQQKLVYVKGQESSCRDCHKEKPGANKVTLERAAHYKCFTCHLDNPGTGPVTCAGCHDKAMQAKIKVVDNPARFKRNQPDFLFISAPDSQLAETKMPTVPFWHANHEGYLPTCRVCHHESMKPCNECHTLGGLATDSATTLQQAMHSLKSSHSCVGCHDEQKSAVECAGCHSLMEQGKLSEHSCPICHAGPKPDRILRPNARTNAKLINATGEAKLTFNPKDIPDTVFIKRLSDKYEAAVFPHKKIIEKLLGYVNDNKIAKHFHGGEDAICQGCHHHSPIGQIPPLCESCHNRPFNENDLYKPGLYGAYHRQCLGCHETMEITKPSDCTGCHAKKTGN